VYKIVQAERIHVSPIVAYINHNNFDSAIYKKHMVTIDEIDGNISAWKCIVVESGTPIGYLKIDKISFINRVINFTLYYNDPETYKKVVFECSKYLFNKFNCQKITTDIIHDKVDTIKCYTSLGGKIEVKKRHHLYTDARYTHIVEVAIFEDEFSNE
jgi:hypothetical protein